MVDHGWFGGMMWMGILFWIIIIGLMIWVVKTLAANATHHTENKVEDPEAILKRRYANGELTPEQFEKMLSDLRN